MKTLFMLTLGLMLHGAAFAQQARQKGGAVIRTGQQHQGASHQSTRSNPAVMEHHRTTSWHYHSGIKRPQVNVDDPAEHIKDRKSPATGNRNSSPDSTGK